MGLVVRHITSKGSDLLDEIRWQKHSLDAFHCNSRSDSSQANPADFSRKNRTILVTCKFHQKFGYYEFPKSGKSCTQISKEGKTGFVLRQEGGRSQS